MKIVPVDRSRLKSMKVGVLQGGLSEERAVSIRSGDAVAKALRESGYDVVQLDVGKDIAARLVTEKIEVAFIALHGRYGEDGCIQGLLESMFIPYTGSGVLASSVGMEKVFTKQVLVAHQIPTPRWAAFESVEQAQSPDGVAKIAKVGLPCVVKPSNEGSSVGVYLCKTDKERSEALDAASKFAGKLMVEQYVKGREVQGAVLDDQALGVIEIKPAREFYDYTAKYGANSGTQYLFPAPLPKAQYDRVMDLCLEAHRALGCAGATRTDAIVTDDGEVTLLEVNTLPGMTSVSLLPKIAAGQGISFQKLCERLLQGASLKA